MCTLLGHSCDITQLACVAENESFNRFVLSIAPITVSATGLHVVNGQMYHYKEKVESLSVERS